MTTELSSHFRHLLFTKKLFRFTPLETNARGVSFQSKRDLKQKKFIWFMFIWRYARLHKAAMEIRLKIYFETFNEETASTINSTNNSEDEAEKVWQHGVVWGIIQFYPAC